MVENKFPPKKREGLLERNVEDEKIIFSLGDHQIHQLNQSAMYIWEQCNGKRSHLDIAEAFATHFSVSIDRAKTDVDETLRKLYELKLLDGD